jgi:hypothetical protein
MIKKKNRIKRIEVNTYTASLLFEQMSKLQLRTFLIGAKHDPYVRRESKFTVGSPIAKSLQLVGWSPRSKKKLEIIAKSTTYVTIFTVRRGNRKDEYVINETSV